MDKIYSPRAPTKVKGISVADNVQQQLKLSIQNVSTVLSGGSPHHTSYTVSYAKFFWKVYAIANKHV